MNLVAAYSYLVRVLFLCATHVQLEVISTQYRHDEGIIMAYSHRHVQSNSDYLVTIQSFQQRHSAAVTVTLTEDSKTIDAQSVSIGAGETKQVIMQVGNVPLSGKILLQMSVAYENGINQLTQKELDAVPNGVTLIQLDKPMYKATEVVSYRVLTLKKDLRLSSNVRYIDVLLKSPTGDVVQEKRNLTWAYKSHPGFFQGSFSPFSFEPETGNWTVEAKYGGDKVQQKRFVVADYYLPRYSVYIEAPPYAFKDQRRLSFSVSLRDQTGNPAFGAVYITIEGPAVGVKQLPPQTANGQTIQVTHQIDSYQTSRLCSNESQPRFLTVKVRAVERLTNREEKGEVKIPFYCDPFTVQIHAKYNTPHPDTATITIRVVNHDGTPYANRTALDTATVTYSNAVRTMTTLRRGVDLFVNYTMGTLVAHVRTDWHAAVNHHAWVEVTVGGVTKRKEIARQAKIWVKARLAESRSYTVGDAVPIIIECGPLCNRMHYTVIGRKRLFPVNVVDVPEQRSQTVTVHITEEMLPLLKVVVYAVDPDMTDLASDVLDIEIVSQELIRNIDLRVEPQDSSHPYVLPGRGNKAKISVTAARNSLVGFLAVDKNLLKLATGHDISRTEIMSKLLGFPMKPMKTQYDYRSYCDWSIGLMDSCNTELLRSTFENANIVVSLFDSDFMMDSVSGKLADPKSTQPQVLRKDFRDSFLFTTKIVDSSGFISFFEPVPDAITTWEVTAFAINPTEPFGLTLAPSELQVYQDCYIHVDLPNTMLEHEKASIEVTVYNFRTHSSGSDAWITVEFSKEPERLNSTQRSAVNSRQPIQHFTFPTGPHKKGRVTVTVSLLQSGLGLVDRVQKSFPIYPGGVLVVRTSKAVVVDGGKQRSWAIPIGPREITELPSFVPDSLAVTLNIFGDIWGSVLKQMSMDDHVKEFDGLIRMPHGCGEQNMALLMPNVFLARYLSGLSTRLSNYPMKKLIQNMEEGFRTQSYYRLADGSYNTFGRKYQPGSTWLTAYVVRGFSIAQDYIAIDQSQIEKSIKFLDSKQDPDGSFREDGCVLDRSLQGGSGTGSALTAFVLLSYIESSHNHSVAERAVKYLQRSFSSASDSYSLAITCFALARSESRDTEKCLEILLGMAVEPKPGTRFWSSHPENRVGSEVTAKDVETTAYALLAMIHGDYKMDIYGSVIRWLLKQRNGNGGFISTQDTVVALNALNDFTSTDIRSGKDFNGAVYVGSQELKRFGLKSRSPTTVSIPISSDANQITITTNSPGKVRAQIEYKYRVIPPRFRVAKGETVTPRPDERAQTTSGLNLKVWIKRLGSDDHLELTICTSYNTNAESGMVMIEAAALTGYKFDQDFAKELEKDPNLGIDRADCVESKTKMELYLKKVGRGETCFQLNMNRYLSVQSIAGRSVSAYRYYEPSISKTLEYSLSDLSG